MEIESLHRKQSRGSCRAAFCMDPCAGRCAKSLISLIGPKSHLPTCLSSRARLDSKRQGCSGCVCGVPDRFPATLQSDFHSLGSVYWIHSIHYNVTTGLSLNAHRILCFDSTGPPIKPRPPRHSDQAYHPQTLSHRSVQTLSL